MKNFTQSLVTMLLVGLTSGSALAKDVYISQSGDDANDGLTATTAVKTLTRLNDVIAKKDIVHVSGMIDMSAEKPADFTPAAAKWTEGGKWMSVSADGKYQGFNISSRDNTKWQGITFIGEDPVSDGFDGNEQVPLFLFRGKNENGTIFRNLGFVNGISNINGGTLVFRDEAVVEFDNCYFFNNHPDWNDYEPDANNLWKVKSGVSASEKGGCVRSEGNCVLTFNNCLFENNINRQGGAICLTGTAKDRTRSGEVKIYNTTFRNNTAYGCVNGDDTSILDNTKGGAIAVYALNQEIYLDIDHCIFDGNCTKNEAGAIWLYDNTKYGHYCDVTITNSAFYKNESNTGGAIEICHTNSLWDDKDYACCQKVKIANTTFSQNRAYSNGGAILLWGASTNQNHANYPKTELWMVNCTVVGNYTDGNGGHCAGYKEMDNGEYAKIDNADRHFYNCLFEGNLALHGGSKQENSDFHTAFLGQDIRNCYFGRIYVAGGMSVEDYIGSLEHAGTIVHSYSGNDVDGTNEYYVANDDYAPGIYDYTVDNENVVPFIPLPTDSPLKTAGDPSLLTLAAMDVENPAKAGVAHPMKGFDITKADQLGFARENGKCAIGASEANVDHIIENYLEDANELPYLKGDDNTTDIKTIIGDTASILTREGDEFIAEDAVISVYSIAGTVVASGNNRVSVANLAPGVYVVKAVSAEGSSAQKFIR